MTLPEKEEWKETSRGERGWIETAGMNNNKNVENKLCLLRIYVYTHRHLVKLNLHLGIVVIPPES